MTGNIWSDLQLSSAELRPRYPTYLTSYPAYPPWVMQWANGGFDEALNLNRNAPRSRRQRGLANGRSRNCQRTQETLIHPPSWRWLVSSLGRGRVGPPVVCGPVGFVEPFGVSRWRVALVPTLTVCDLLIMIMGQLASFGLSWWRRAGRQTRGGITPKVLAILRSACVQRSVEFSIRGWAARCTGSSSSERRHPDSLCHRSQRRAVATSSPYAIEPSWRRRHVARPGRLLGSNGESTTALWC